MEHRLIGIIISLTVVLCALGIIVYRYFKNKKKKFNTIKKYCTSINCIRFSTIYNAINRKYNSCML